ncbi:hypothetical protein SJAV_04850 [Sulfurisphaera javensis]|uniref:Uncharacterized protein n=1 Tax=Sulfurisphaera javensis TaxID=2049879 RepID=A0AAT9GNS9_9CREN
MFWDHYRLIEQGTKVNLDEFLSNEELKKKVKKGIKGLYTDVMALVERCVNKKGEEAIWELAKLKIISPNIVQELIDVIELVNKIDEIDDSIIYSMLVRIMEDLEELYISISSRC